MRLLRYLALLSVLVPFSAVHAQTVTQQPQHVSAGAMADIGNGPVEFRMLGGNMGIATSQSSGTGSTVGGAATLLSLTATPTTVPCVGCIISGTGITSGTTVAAYNSGTGITLSAIMTVTSTTVSWGAACPASPPTAPLALVQASVGQDLPFYTQARVCAYGINGPGGTFTTFAIGAH